MLAETAVGTEVACGDTWRLAVATPLYLPGLPGILERAQLAAAPVNYLRAGYWVPPGVCGELRVRNTWALLGEVSLLTSVTTLVVAGWSFLGRRRVGAGGTE